MAYGASYSCKACEFSIEVWSDGDPYITDPFGKRHYFHHPGEDAVITSVGRMYPGAEDLDYMKLWALVHKRIGARHEYICQDCGRVWKADSAERPPYCRFPKCASKKTFWTHEFFEKTHLCPKCKVGFIEQTDTMIS
jgi:hypothetical protein